MRDYDVSNTQVARELRVTVQTVGTWRCRFLRLRLKGLADAPRSGALRTITDANVEHVVTLTLERKPTHATQWSTRSLAKRCGLTMMQCIASGALSG
jgi:transposase